MAVIAAYIDYLMNLEENKPTTSTAENTAISRWRAFGLQKGVLRV
jgi:acetyl-CoA carboxylase biotin carboxylase subunit